MIRQKIFQNMTIRQQLNFLALFPTGLALLAACCLLSLSAKQQFEKSMKVELESLTAVIGQAAEASILFNDSTSAQRFLDALTAKENIVSASINSTDGTLLASYKGNSIIVKDLEKNLADDQNLNSSSDITSCGLKFCQTSKEIKDGQNVLGRITIISDLSGLELQLKDNAKVLVWSIFLAFLVALSVAYGLRGLISHPLLKIASLVGRVSKSHDYSLRLPIVFDNKGRNEISTVISGLNQMLDQIERRDLEIVAARHQADQASKAKSEFVANTSHEIRTPINNIIGFTEILAETVKTPEETRYIDLIKISAESLLTIINDILDLSKIEAGKLELDPISCNLGIYLQRIIAPLQVQAEKKGLSFSFSIDAQVPKNLLVDANRLGQVVINFINNAIKFTDSSGAVSLSLTTQELGSNAATIVVAVSDTGIGIPLESQARIFEAFRQADASTTRKFGGTGLGLAISKSIIQLMGGTVEMKSSPGKGSRFSFIVSLPLAESEEQLRLKVPPNPADRIQKLAQLPATKIESNKIPLARILVVEDNALSREIALHRLSKAQFDVTVAKNGLEAVERFSEERFDLVLMDCQMPEMDGFEATRLIRKIDKERGNRTMIVALTAHAMDGYKDTCIQAGMDDYLDKPIDEKRLLDFILQFSLNNSSGTKG